MKIGGIVEVNGLRYFAILNQTKSYTAWSICTEYTESDLLAVKFGGKPKYKPIDMNLGFNITREHVIEHVLRKKSGNEVYNLPGSNNEVITKILDTISAMRVSGYKIGESSTSSEIRGTEYVKIFKGRTKSFITSYELIGNQYSLLQYKDKDLFINMRQLPSLKTLRFLPSRSELVKANRTITERVYVENVSSIGFEDLCRIHDTSWLIDEVDGTLFKDYRMIETIEEFEEYVINELLRELRQCRSCGEKLLLGMDTETTGLNIYNLPEGSEIKDHIVTMQLSWRDNQSVLINFDMEKFGNVPLEYAMKRLHPLVKEYIRKDKKKINKIYTITGEEFEFTREDILVIGHNTLFDCRVTFDTNYPWFFDEDTMQLRFNLDPVGSKGNKGLKLMTKQFQGVDQWELSDTLGKGNEDKFRYIQDKMVAIAYGCADSDFTRMNWKILRRITPDLMYKAYKKFNMYTWYILAESEYTGIRLDEKQLKEKTELVRRNLETIKDFVYYSVGNSVEKSNIMYRLALLEKAGALDKPIDEAFREEWSKIDKSADTLKLKYKFDMGGDALRDVLYNKLNYPKLVFTETGAPAVNKETIQRLLKYEHKTPRESMKDHLYTEDYDRDNPAHHDKDGNPLDEYILIDKKKYNRYKFPIAYVLSKYKELEKEYTGYYVPFSKGDWGGRIYKGYSTTNIETQRISNPIQTTKKDLKKMIIATGPDWYPVNWDKAQIEARVFVAEAGDYKMVRKLNNPENDYHTENAALMFNTPAYLVSKDLRKASKTINFGLPYGLGVDKMCERIHDMVINESTKLDTQLKIAAYKRANILTWNLLEGYRDSALKEWHCSDEFKKYLGYEGRKLGHITNASGFHRLFDLTDVTENWQREKIRRAAGNFPIQSYAKDIFTLSIIRLYIRLGELGLRDKFQIHMLVHDEIQCSAHKSLDPVYLMSLFAECCMPSIKCKEPAVQPTESYTERDTFMNYFIGINFGKSWYDCKLDANECPVGYVFWMIKKLRSGEYKPVDWCDNPRDIIEPTMHEYFKERLHEVFGYIQPNMDSAPIDYELIIKKITNYTARAWTTDFFKSPVPLTGKPSADIKFFASLTGWALEYYGENKLVNYLDKTCTILDLINNNMMQDVKEETVSVFTESLFEKDNDDDDFLDLEQVDNYSFDDDESINEYFDMRGFVIEEEESAPMGEFIGEKASRIEAKRRDEALSSMSNVKLIGSVAVVYCSNDRNYTNVLSTLKSNILDTGETVRVSIVLNGVVKRNLKVMKNIDWLSINKMITDDSRLRMTSFSKLNI